MPVLISLQLGMFLLREAYCSTNVWDSRLKWYKTILPSCFHGNIVSGSPKRDLELSKRNGTTLPSLCSVISLIYVRKAYHKISDRKTTSQRKNYSFSFLLEALGKHKWYSTQVSGFCIERKIQKTKHNENKWEICNESLTLQWNWT